MWQTKRVCTVLQKFLKSWCKFCVSQPYIKAKSLYFHYTWFKIHCDGAQRKNFKNMYYSSKKPHKKLWTSLSAWALWCEILNYNLYCLKQGIFCSVELRYLFTSMLAAWQILLIFSALCNNMHISHNASLFGELQFMITVLTETQSGNICWSSAE